MSDSATDFHQQKTDAELRSFVDNPGQYQPALVEAATRELRRRGVFPPASAPAPAYEPLPEASAAPRRSGLVLAGVAVAAVLLGTGYVVTHQTPPPPPITKPHKAPRLEEVATTAMPVYDAAVARCVAQQLARVPVAERAAAQQAGQPLSQYRELAKRFWSAETLTEFVTAQARAGKTSAAFPGQVELVQASWDQWNKAQVYGYKFGPVMSNHLDLMTRVARQQQEGLADVLLVARNPQPFDNEQTRRRAADMNDMLAGLLSTSPVSGKPYETVVRHVRL